MAHASWRWLFFVNTPLMALALWRVGRLPAAAPSGAKELPDVAGALTFAAAVTLVWVTFAGHRVHWFSA